MRVARYRVFMPAVCRPWPPAPPRASPMSSRLAVASCHGEGGVGEEGSVDDVGQLSLERSQRLGLGVAARQAPLQVCLRTIVNAHLGDRDAVDGGVDLTVPRPREA